MQTNLITEVWRGQGYELREDGDHVLELRKDGQVLARFSQTGVEVENILREVQAGKYQN
jgi:hypothetical protein